jgi:galactonate dehydratase
MPSVRSVEAFAVSLPREVPYLGPLGPGESVNAKGYIVRKGNRTIYPSSDMSVIVRAETADGVVGWGRPTASWRPARSSRSCAT